MISVDVLILGAGPAGLTAALYAARGGLSVAILEHAMPGGQAALTPEIENYPGFAKIDGVTLTQNMLSAATAAGAKLYTGSVIELSLGASPKKCSTATHTFLADYVILCTGCLPKGLGVGEEKFLGRGVSYCAACDGALYKNKEVAVVGGGNTALEDALYLAKLCPKVTLIHRREGFRGAATLVERVKKNPNIELLLSAQLTGVSGTSKLENLAIKSREGERTLAVDGLFLAVGQTPASSLFQEVALDAHGYVLTDDLLQTNLLGVLAAGDVRQKQLRQIVTACADGAMAAERVVSLKNA